MMNKNPKNVIPFLFLFIFARPICSINFLLFLIGTNQFERNTFEFLAQELARRGHKVVTVKPILIPEEPQLVKPLLHLVHEKVLKDVLPQRLFVPLERVGEDVPWRENYEVEAYLKPYWAAHIFACQRMLNSNLMNILAQEQLELAILYSGNPCQQGIALALGIPFVVVDLDGLTDQTLVAAGAAWDNLPKEIIFPPPSFLSIPNFIFRRFVRSFSLVRESLAQSGIPSIALSISERYRQLEYPIWLQFQSNSEFRRKFRNGFPQLNLGNAELLLANTDPLLESSSFSFCPSRLLPIGGIHIDSIRPLFAPWNESIANSQFGTILVSLGTQANTNSMPEKLVRAFLHAFRHLANYRIFWRISPKLTLSGFNSTQIDKLALEMPNLNITTFFPQNELLAHPRTQLLITNGGIHSLMEAMHWGVPVLGIPLYGQNLANLEKVKMRGFGTWIGKNEAKDGEKLIGAIKMVLGNSRFTRKAKDLGREIRSRPSRPMQNILHAFESIVRRKRLNPANFKERKSSPTLSFIFRLNIDIFLIFIIFVTLFYGIGYAALKLVLLCFCWPISTILAKSAAIMTVKATILGIGRGKYGNGRGKEGLKEE